MVTHHVWSLCSIRQSEALQFEVVRVDVMNLILAQKLWIFLKCLKNSFEARDFCLFGVGAFKGVEAGEDVKGTDGGEKTSGIR